MKRLYTYVPDLPDFRDLAYGDYGPKVAKAPDKTSNWGNPFCSKVKNQKTIGSCTAHGGTSTIEYVRRKSGLKTNPLSRLMYYYGERSYEHTTAQDSGAQVRDGIKFAVKVGVCEETLWPYIISKFKLKPPAKCYTAGAANRVSKYVRLGGTLASGKKGDLAKDLVNCLASGLPVVFGFTVYESFESEEVANTGFVPMPKRGEQTLGGHCVYAIDYDFTGPEPMVLCVNSWGTGWGIKGTFWIPLRYLTNENLAEDFWAILPTA
jgi:C1A family cysteine protease